MLHVSWGALVTWVEPIGYYCTHGDAPVLLNVAAHDDDLAVLPEDTIGFDADGTLRMVPAVEVPAQTVHVSIGNTDNGLSQQRWHAFWSDVDACIREHTKRVYGAWVSPSTAPYQNAAWAFEEPLADVTQALRVALSGYAALYDQDSIAWCRGFTDFIEGTG